MTNFLPLATLLLALALPAQAIAVSQPTPVVGEVARTLQQSVQGIMESRLQGGISIGRRGAAGAREIRGGANIPMGRRGNPMRNSSLQPLRNADAVIDGRTFGGHALDQMQNRGIPPSAVENTIRSGRGVPDPLPGRMRYYDPRNDITVITERERVVTVIHGNR